ncbi:MULTISPECIES: type II toxin-antitoxin system HicA family toxin [Pseudomonas]|uniref:type II toxin-antitoxin system HicA family toxin n=1 Tax=Pseudomonas TaxID=286 RepID=UPI002852E733|nr:type II toxin-antitoxin system HicA family toxin [Pseudomonas atacamensis]
MNNKQRGTLKAIFSRPVPNNLEWVRMESLFGAVGAQTIEGNGSRVRFELNGVVVTFSPAPPRQRSKALSGARRSGFS